MMNLIFVYTCVLCSMALAQHGRDNSVCTPPQPSATGPTRSHIPPLYTVNTECNLLDKQYTLSAQEWYDGPNNRAKMMHKSEGLTTLDYFYYDTNEILSVNITGGFMNGSEHIYQKGSAFEFGGNIPEEYLGTATIRGITTDAWRSCLYWDTLDATMNVTWYFTTKDKWISASGVAGSPVRCHVTGRRYTSPTAYHDFDHIYEFSYFSTTVDQTAQVFEVPPLTVCPGRKDTKKRPRGFLNYFKTKTEVVVPDSKFISFIWEWYDFTTKVSRFQYRPMAAGSHSTSTFMTSTYGSNFITEIHDYNTGLAFVIDNVRGNCSVHPITVGMDSEVVDSHHVRMQSIQDFYSADPGTLAYEGTKSVRGIDCDVWVAVKNDFPVPGSGINSTFEWYLATQDWLAAHGFSSQYNLPVMSKIAAPAINYYATFNTYDYDEDEPSLINFDTTSCFGPSQKKDVKFVLPAKYKKYVSDEMSMFRYFVLVTVSGYTTLSPTRINNIKVDYLDSKDLLISLRMLGVPPVPGDVVNPVYQMPLQDAVDMLTFGINTGNFTIDINGVSMRAQPYSVTSKDTVIEEHPWKNVKLEYTGGSVVGLGVGMLILSFILGFIIYLVIKKKRS